MDTMTENIFKALDSKKPAHANGKLRKPKNPRPTLRMRSRFEIVKEKIDAVEPNNIELPPFGKALIPKGWRNSTLRWLGFAMKDAMVDRKTIEHIVRRAASEICLPPCSNKETNYILEGVFKEPSIDMMEK